MRAGAGTSEGRPGGREILLVAYFYPPCRDTGAHRPAAMARHLTRLGHRVTVLTSSAYGGERGPRGGPDPPRADGEPGAGGATVAAAEAAASDLPVAVERTPDLQLLRARLHGHDRVEAMFDSDSYSGRPHPLSRIIVPEPLLVAWAPFAVVRGLRLLRRSRPDCVITTSPPESSHLVGRALSRRGVAWVADIRDAWSFERLRPEFPTRVQRRLDARLERRWLGAADAVTCVSRPAADDLRDRGIADPLLVPNGWDPDATGGSSPEAVPALDPDRVSLVYTGRFGSYGRDPAPLVAALRALAAEEPAAAERIELAIAGPLTEAERELLAADFSPARVSLLGSLLRPVALELQRSADALLVVASPRRTQLANLKLYEYLVSGRPILALAEGTEAGRIVAEAGGEVVRADDVEAIRAALLRLAAGELRPPPAESSARYAYPAVAERMAEAVEQAIEHAAARPV